MVVVFRDAVKGDEGGVENLFFADDIYTLQSFAHICGMESAHVRLEEAAQLAMSHVQSICWTWLAVSKCK